MIYVSKRIYANTNIAIMFLLMFYISIYSQMLFVSFYYQYVLIYVPLKIYVKHYNEGISDNAFSATDQENDFFVWYTNYNRSGNLQINF